MRNPLLTQLHIGVGQNAMGLALFRPGLRAGAPLLIEQPRAGAQADDLALLLKNLPVQRGLFRPRWASITIADSMARFFMVTPPANAAGRADLEAAAAIRFESLYGEAPGEWKIQSSWHFGRAFLACALPAALHATLLQGMAGHRLALMEMRPRFVAVWNRWRHRIQPDAWFVVIEPDHLILAILSGHAVAAVRSTRLPPPLHQPAHWIAEHLQREALVLGLALPPLVQFCGHSYDALPQAYAGMVFRRLDMQPPPASPWAGRPGMELALSGAS